MGGDLWGVRGPKALILTIFGILGFLTISLPKLLALREGTKTCSGHNVHEKFTLHQQGGVFMAAMASVSEQVIELGGDEAGLGRWCWMKFQGRQVTTRVVVVSYVTN